MEQPLTPGLYIVATPIGNLGDITRRAEAGWGAVALVACEDTRVTGRLLSHLGIKARLLRHDDHADERAREALLARIAVEPVALVSDAGTPLISDPGYRLVRAARERGLAVTVVPGASALTAAIALAGLPSDRFLFAGFLPSKAKARDTVLAELAATPATLVFYETAPRLAETLAAMEHWLAGRELAVARELTKLYEECRGGTAAELIAHYTAHPPRGEIVLLAGPPPAAAPATMDEAEAMLRAELAHAGTERPATVHHLEGGQLRQ